MKKTDKTPVVIFGDYISAIGAIKGLSKDKIPIYLVSPQGKGIALKSRYVRNALVLEPEDLEFIPKLDHWIAKHVGMMAVLMVAGDDRYLDVLSKDYRQLTGDIRPTFPDWSTVRMVRQKRLTYETATSVGIPVPMTRYITNRVDLELFLEKDYHSFRFPLFLKMENSNYLLKNYGTKGEICHNREQVIDAYRRFDGFRGDLLIQELITGDVERIVTVLMVLNHNSEPIGFSINEKKRSSGKFLSGTLVVSTWSNELLQDSIRLAKAIGYYGYAGFQFKYDSEDGCFKLLEVNGRISMSNSLSLKCGANLSLLMYQEAVHQDLQEIADYRRKYSSGIVWWYPTQDIIAYWKFNRRYLGLWDYLKSLIGKGYTIEPFSWRDPYPGLLSIVSLMRTLLRRVERMITTRGPK